MLAITDAFLPVTSERRTPLLVPEVGRKVKDIKSYLFQAISSGFFRIEIQLKCSEINTQFNNRI